MVRGNIRNHRHYWNNGLMLLKQRNSKIIGGLLRDGFRVRENKDYGPERFGGSIILREAYQLPNGGCSS